ncbi:methyl-accepting chemotaxis protein [Amphibacillus sp. Q70]|uniref:methyl-accepting chemotaxis protein n=1 Tax=Amphibacillus sp. Q70 TaxID=3453416 RepID=UPI003F85880E
MTKIKIRFRSISIKLMAVVISMILLIGVLIGTGSYFIARAQLIDAGERDLKSIVDGSLAVLSILDQQVTTGELSLPEAQDQARIILNGPEYEEDVFDYLQSNFTYKEGGYLLAYDPDYILQVHPTRFGQAPRDELNRQNRAIMIEAGQAEALENQYVNYTDPMEDGTYRDKVAYMQHFEPWDWTVGMAVFQDEFYEDLHSLSLFIASVIGILVILSGFVFYFIIRMKIKVLKATTQVAKQIADGHIEQTELKEGTDEFGQLAAAFNKMSKQLKHLIVNIQQTSTQLRDSATDMSATSEQTAASSQEVGEAVNEIAGGTQDQANDLEDVNMRVEALTKTLESMFQLNDKMHTITGETAQVATDGNRIIEKLEQSNTNSLTASEKISQDINQLSDHVAEITEVMETIENIAEETNLLALNASIEAARAGEHGKGFSVVAEEIRNLAAQSKSATKHVHEVVSTIINETAKTVKAVSDTMKTTKALNADVEETKDQFDQLSVSIEGIVDALTASASEMSQIKVHNQEIRVAIESASSVAEETAASVEEIASTVDEQTRVMNNVSESAEKLTELNQVLTQLLTDYQVK